MATTQAQGEVFYTPHRDDDDDEQSSQDEGELTLASLGIDLDLDLTVQKCGHTSGRVISTKPLTEPIAFSSHYEQLKQARLIKQNKNQAAGDDAAEVASPNANKLNSPMRYRPMRRRSSRVQNRYHKWSQEQRRKAAFISLAEVVRKFQTTTPDRFHSVAASKDVYHAPPHVDFVPTVPMTPEFETDKRIRPVAIQSTEDKIVSQFVEFKATELNPKIFESQGDYGVPRVEKKPLTQPVEFNLHKPAFKETVIEETEVVAFHAQPIPASLFDGPSGIPTRQAIPLTIPQSPHLTKPSFDKSTLAFGQPQPEVVFKAKPAPDFSHAFEPRHSTTTTLVEPFALTRAEDPYKRRELLAQEETKKLAAMREFHANPMPDLSEVSLPSVAPLPITVPEPFELRSEELHEQYQQVWQEKLEDMIEQEDYMRNKFHAEPVKACEPFQPKKSSRPLTEVNEFALSSDTRGRQRQEFDRMQKEKETEALRLEQERKEIARIRELAEIALLRKQIVHKARPVPKFKPMQVAPSKKVLTQPQTPTVAKRRSALRP
eukprot:m.719074 g.719074  ORF g.719074 m.719074 type:complete len:545 (-) comp58810_c0_seq16:3597-5231(-)